MANRIPTLRCVKDEAGDPLARVAQIRERTHDKLAVFSGNGVRTMIDEMRLGFWATARPWSSRLSSPPHSISGTPAAAEAFDMFRRIQAFAQHHRSHRHLHGGARRVQGNDENTRGSFAGAPPAGGGGCRRPAAADEPQTGVREPWTNT